MDSPNDATTEMHGESAKRLPGLKGFRSPFLEFQSSMRELVRAQSGIAEMFKASSGIGAGFSAQSDMAEMLKASSGIGELLKVQNDIAEMLKASSGCGELLKAQSSMAEMLKSSSGIGELLKVQSDMAEMLKASSGIGELLKVQNDMAEMLKASSGIGAAITAKSNVAEMLQASSGISEMLRTQIDISKLLKEMDSSTLGLLQHPVAGFVGSLDRLDSQEILLQAVVTPVAEVSEGEIIRSIAIPWIEIVKLLRDDPDAMHKISWRKWEEMLAAAYCEAGFDEVVLTPRSGDHGRDVVATKYGFGTIRIFDQMKAYKPGHVVPANDIRAMLGVITGAGNVSKGIITTTSHFAPGINKDPFIAPLLPYRLELKDKDALLKWLISLAFPLAGNC